MRIAQIKNRNGWKSCGRKLEANLAIVESRKHKSGITPIELILNAKLKKVIFDELVKHHRNELNKELNNEKDCYDDYLHASRFLR